MKNNKPQLYKDYAHRLFVATDRVIEHRLFRPIAISIITCFVLFQGYEFINDAIFSYREYSIHKQQTSPIKVKVSSKDVDFDIEDQVIEHQVKSGDTMMKILFNLGVDEKEVATILQSMRKVFNLRLDNGDQITIKYRLKLGAESEQTEASSSIIRRVIVEGITISTSPEESIIVLRGANNTFETKRITVKLSRQISRYHGTIRNSLFEDGVRAGISPTSMMNMINLYGYDVDFQRDIHKGDKFEMLIESFYSEDGRKVKDGNVIYASLSLSNRTIETYMHKIGGVVEYFDAKGNSVRKSLLRTPINGARISSGFGMRRHPILGYSRMHKGMDFAAPTGTPILAAGSGIITHYGVKGGYGNYVQIKHNESYSTAYGHASRFNKKLRRGSKVKQGEVVAYVGTTGRSTGPHLHYEIHFKGSQINPAKVKATSGLRLGGKELLRFKDSKSEIDRYRKNIPNQIKNK